MAQLAYFCATETKRISVINGLQKGGSVARIKKAVEPKMLHKL